MLRYNKMHAITDEVVEKLQGEKSYAVVYETLENIKIEEKMSLEDFFKLTTFVMRELAKLENSEEL